MTQIQSRNYIFTFNNYPTDLSLFNAKLSEICQYAIYGKEIAPTTGTLHLQGYVQLKCKERLTGLSKKLPGCHLEQARGGYDANFAYCSKEGLSFTHGYPDTVGKRKGLEEACEAIKNGTRLLSIAEEDPLVYARYSRGLQALSDILVKPRNFKTEVFWFFGPTGSGKSRRVYDEEPDLYTKSPINKWWDGYCGQSAVIIDDYRRDFCTFAELLRLFDRYAYPIERKGGTSAFGSRRVYITTPRSPRETWEGRSDEDLRQLLRRIDHVYEFTGVNFEYIDVTGVLEPTDKRLAVEELIEKYGSK